MFGQGAISDLQEARARAVLTRDRPGADNLENIFRIGRGRLVLTGEQGMGEVRGGDS